jgi:hypothetical protein
MMIGCFRSAMAADLAGPIMAASDWPDDVAAMCGGNCGGYRRLTRRKPLIEIN